MTAAERVAAHTARTDLGDRIATWRAKNPHLDTMDALLAASRVVENLLRLTVGLPPDRRGVLDGLDSVLNEWADAHPVIAGPVEVVAVLLDHMATTARLWADGTA